MTAAVALQTASRKRSPSLRGFESNPFRILRLPVNATTSAAALQAESALTLSRVGLEPDEPDQLPWLPPVETFELQQAAQSAIIWLAIWIGKWAIRLLPVFTRFCFRCFWQYGLAGFFTPKGHTRYGDYKGRAAYRNLSSEGYDVEPRFAAGVIASIRTD